ncbi:MAG: protein phosphatase 2C domain-containing protein [Actinomycetota bacterium]|nr:protein phosphatase 2C domain-containing protein [Actinomycetota bacterium]
MLRFSGVGRTNVGLVRADNEDSAFVGPTLMLVADGVGGNAGGEIASATSAYVVSASALSRVGLPPAGVLAAAVTQSQRQVAAGIRHSPALTGMATTLTALLTDGQHFALAHLGDSRGYVFRDDTLTRITSDHTWVQQMQDDGRMTEAEASIHPWRNVVMRTVNGDPAYVADIVPLALRPGDRVLLASDGLTDLVSDGWIEQILGSHADDAAVDMLVDAALSAGGRDNITCVLATVVEGPAVSADGQLLGAVRDPSNIIDAAAVRAHASA